MPDLPAKTRRLAARRYLITRPEQDLAIKPPRVTGARGQPDYQA